MHMAGSVKTQDALAERGRRLRGGHPAGGEVGPRRMAERDRGGDQPGRAEGAVELTGLLAAPDQLFQTFRDGRMLTVGVGRVGGGYRRVPQEWVAVEQPPGD